MAPGHGPGLFQNKKPRPDFASLGESLEGIPPNA